MISTVENSNTVVLEPCSFDGAEVAANEGTGVIGSEEMVVGVLDGKQVLRAMGLPVVGTQLGFRVGRLVGVLLGCRVGPAVGGFVGDSVGHSVGGFVSPNLVGVAVTRTVGDVDGALVGLELGGKLGELVGKAEVGL